MTCLQDLERNMPGRPRPTTIIKRFERTIELGRANWHVLDSYPTRQGYCDAIGRWWLHLDLVLCNAGLRHRYGIGDSQADIREFVAESERMARLWAVGNRLRYVPESDPEGKFVWRNAPQRVDAIHFRFGAAALLSLLEYDEPSPVILKVVPRTADGKDFVNGFHFRNFADAGLLEMLRTGRTPRYWQYLLERGSSHYRNRRVQRAVECWGTIILATRKRRWDEAVEAVREAERLFAERDGAPDEFEAWEVPGAATAQGIDLRLSALMRHCFRENPTVLDPLESVHRWGR